MKFKKKIVESPTRDMGEREMGICPNPRWSLQQKQQYIAVLVV